MTDHERKRRLACARSKRQRERDKAGHRVGRYLDTRERRNALCLIGLLREFEADQQDGADLGVDRLLRRLEQNAEAFRIALRGQRRF